MSFARLSGIGLQFGAVLCIFALAGRFVDGRLGTRPVFLVLGVFVGAAAGIYSMWKKVQAAIDRPDRDPDRRTP